MQLHYDKTYVQKWRYLTDDWGERFNTKSFPKSRYSW